MQQLNYCAFFDVDGTLLRTNSMFSFLKFHFEKISRFRWIGTLKFYCYRRYVKHLEKINVARELLNRQYYQLFQNEKLDVLRSIGCEWFKKLHASTEIYFNKTLLELRSHQKKGATIVLVSGSFAECLQPLADILNIKHILATRLEVNNGYCTGNILSPQTIGQGKVEAIKQFLLERNIDANHCHAYGDHISDLAMLETVGYPHVVAVDPALKQVALARSWPTL